MNRKQCKMARAALGWRASDLADASGVHRVTVARYERGDEVDAKTLQAMRTALEREGVLFSTRSGRVAVGVPE
jgi:transcriptional regulator with XRE-family HTH domain